MKSEILIEPVNPRRQSSFWYNEELIVANYKRNDRYIKVEVVGEIIIDFPKNDKEDGYIRLKNAQASDYALAKNYTDDDLNNFTDKELIKYSNWFSFVCKKGKYGEWEEVKECVYSTIEEFQIAAKNLMNDDTFWEMNI
jgi:hypothetical protein